MDVVYSRSTRPVSNCKASSGSRCKSSSDWSRSTRTQSGNAQRDTSAPPHSRTAIFAGELVIHDRLHRRTPADVRTTIRSLGGIAQQWLRKASPSRAMPSRYGLGRRTEGGARRPSDWLQEDDTSAQRGVLDARDPKDETRTRFDRVVRLRHLAWSAELVTAGGFQPCSRELFARTNIMAARATASRSHVDGRGMSPEKVSCEKFCPD